MRLRLPCRAAIQSKPHRPHHRNSSKIARSHYFLHSTRKRTFTRATADAAAPSFAQCSLRRPVSSLQSICSNACEGEMEFRVRTARVPVPPDGDDAELASGRTLLRSSLAVAPRCNPSLVSKLRQLQQHTCLLKETLMPSFSTASIVASCHLKSHARKTETLTQKHSTCRRQRKQRPRRPPL